MIGCDANDCEREWFHLSCVGLSTIPKGSWFCSDCRVSIANVLEAKRAEHLRQAKREKKKKR